MKTDRENVRFFVKSLLFLAVVLMVGSKVSYSKEFVTQLKSYQKSGNEIILKCTNATVKVQICAEDIFRIRMSKDGLFAPDENYVVIQYNWPKVDFKIREKNGIIEISTLKARLKISKNPLAISLLNLEGKTIVSDFEDGSMGFSGDSVFCRKQLTETDHFFGLGQRYEKSDLRGEKRDCWTTRHVTPVPFFMGTEGYGIFFHNTFRSTFDFTKNPYTFSAPGGEMDYYLIYGPEFKHILKQYTEITGRSPLPPKWAFGFFLSKWDQKFDTKVTYRQEGQDGMLSEVRTCREIKDWPLDGIRIHSLGCHQNFYASPSTNWGAGEWGEFYDLPQMMQQLHDWNCHALFWENPGVMADCDMQKDGAQKRYLLEENGKPWVGSFGYGPKEGSLADFMNPEVRDWWGSKHKFMIDFGSDGVAGDYWMPGHVTLGSDDLHSPYNGMKDSEYHNILSLLYNQASYDAYKKYAPDKRSIVFGLTFWAGGQRYPMHGTQDSDLQEGADNIIGEMMGCINLGLSGIPFRTYTDNVSRMMNPKESNVRLSQYLTLTVAGERTEVSATGNPVADSCYRYYAKLRYQMMPYIYSYVKETTQNGVPLIRSLILEYQNDPKTYSAYGEYLMGKEILMAPLWQDTAFQRDIYLPHGTWYDFWDDTTYEGGKTITYDAPISKVPIFIKAGAIIPMAPGGQKFMDEFTSPLTVHIWPSQKSNFELYEDDGISYNFEKGDFATTAFNCIKDDKSIQIIKSMSQGNYKLPERDIMFCIHKVPDVKSVLLNNKSCAQYFKKNAFESSTQGWYYDNISKTIWVKAKDDSKKELSILII